MKVSLFYTNICNFNCMHCFINKSLPQKRMNKKMFTKILQDICKKKNLVNSIGISGGEPVLFLDEIVDLIKANRFEQKLRFSISSNAYWATTIDESNLICRRLSSANITRLEISYDLFHAKYIDMNNIFNVSRVAKKLGMDMYIIFSVTNGVDYLPLYIDLCKIIDKNKIILQHVANYGNAKFYGLDCSIPFSSFENKKCHQILNPCVDYNGDFYACCGANILNQNSPLYIGNICSHSFEYLLDKMNSNLKYQIILNEGPFHFVKDKQIREYSSLCELCNLLE